IYKRDAAFVRVWTDEDLVGDGPAPASERVVAQINGPIRGALLGEDPGRTEALRTKALAGPARGAADAYGAVEIALYDLRGKLEGCPVHALLGGKVRHRIRLYGSAGM